MGAHRIVTASTLFLQPPQPDNTPKTRQPSAGIACELSAALRYKLRLGIALLGLLAACESGPGQTSGGNLQVRWSGREPGRLSASATAGWCAPRHVLEVRSIQGDTGVALALYPAETLTAGVYRVVEPTRAESLPPAAAVALRWLTPKVVQGFRGESGSVQLQRSSSGQVSGEMSLRARSVVDTQRVTITGSFQGLTLQLQPPHCGSPGALDEAPEPPDTSVH